MIQWLALPDNLGFTGMTMYGCGPMFVDGAGCKWALADSPGLEGSAPVKQAVLDRPFQDGSVLAPFQNAGRAFEIHGGIQAPSRDALADAITRLKACTALRDGNNDPYSPVVQTYETLDDSGTPVQLLFRARRVGALEVQYRANGLGAEFSVPMLAPDYRKYANIARSAQVTGAGTITAVNVGSAPVYPVLDFIGAGTTPRLTVTNWGNSPFVELIGAQASGTTSVYNRSHAISSSTYYRSNVNYQSVFFPLMPGTNSIDFTGTSIGSMTARVRWAEAYE